MPRDDALYLRHVLDAIGRVEQYLENHDEVYFLETPLIQDGVIRQLEVIGEAVRHISRDLRSTYPEVPWKDVAGMRDKLIHDYFGVDLRAVWLTATQDLIPLQEQVEGILRDFGFTAR